MHGSDPLLGLGEDHAFRRLVGWRAREARSDGTPVVDDFSKFLDDVNEALNRYAALPDGDVPALRISTVRDKAQELWDSVNAINSHLEPKDAEQHALLEGLRRVLTEAEYIRLDSLQKELDHLHVVLSEVVPVLRMRSGAHGMTNYARRATIIELTRLFDAFVSKHETQNGRNATALRT